MTDGYRTTLGQLGGGLRDGRDEGRRVKREMGREDGRTDRGGFLSCLEVGGELDAVRQPLSQTASQSRSRRTPSLPPSLPRRMDEAARGDDFLYKTVGVVRWISLPR